MAGKGNVTAHNAKVMNRFELTRRLVGQLKREEAVIGGIGNANFDLWASGQRPQNFYMLGSMGLAIPIALGVAIAQPQRHVIALEGDGSLLMQLGAESVFVGSGIFKSTDPKRRARAIVASVTHFEDPKKLVEVSRELGEAMPGIETSSLPADKRMQERGW